MAESTVGPWAADKLEHLGKYLRAYTTIMRKQQFEGYYYIDAFAGPGQHEVRRAKASRSVPAQHALLEVASFANEEEKQQQFLAGSPRVALESEPPFSGYVFVERSRERVAALKRLKAEFKGRRKIAIRQGDCTRYLRHSVAHNPEIDWPRNRAFVFLDPFGMQVGWDTISLLAETKAIDILFSAMFPRRR